MNLKRPTKKIPRISDKYAQRLKRLGIQTLGDLLFHFPHRYEDFRERTKAEEAEVGDTVCLRGRIVSLKNQTTSQKRMVLTKALLRDDSGLIQAIWFRQPYLKKALSTEKEVCLAGEVKLGKEGPFLSNPVYEKISGGDQIHTGRLVPVYPETEGLSSRWLRYVLFPLLKKLAPRMPETLPTKIKEEEGLPPLNESLFEIHFPASREEARRARDRFAFEELFLLELKVLKERAKTKKEKGFPVPLREKIVEEFIESLPFPLTGAQERAGREILEEMAKPHPMRRLLQGDVGSGKTVVCLLAALNTVKGGFQTAFMAPTEILACQHFKTLEELLEGEDLKLGLLTGSRSWLRQEDQKLEVPRSKVLEGLRRGEVKIAVGTQALIQEGVEFEKLALAVVDEQHRFGVEQRSRLIEQRKPRPHLLTMTATPIPRSLALTAYGDLNISLIDEMPEGRKKVETRLVPREKREVAYRLLREEVRKGRQGFIVCPRISSPEEKNSPWSGVKAVKREYENLAREVFPELKVERLHGELSSEKKRKTMESFQKGEVDILVSTSVIEVGVDVARASVMIVEGAERFGLAQLHQLRGRVGRSQFKSHCFLLPSSLTEQSRERLRALEQSNDGFELAEKDLELRGPGKLLGERQSGPADLMLSSLGNIELVKRTRRQAREILEDSPDLEEYEVLKKRLRRFEKEVHLE